MPQISGSETLTRDDLHRGFIEIARVSDTFRPMPSMPLATAHAISHHQLPGAPAMFNKRCRWVRCSMIRPTWWCFYDWMLNWWYFGGFMQWFDGDLMKFSWWLSDFMLLFMRKISVGRTTASTRSRVLCHAFQGETWNSHEKMCVEASYKLAHKKKYCIFSHDFKQRKPTAWKKRQELLQDSFCDACVLIFIEHNVICQTFWMKHAGRNCLSTACVWWRRGCGGWLLEGVRKSEREAQKRPTLGWIKLFSLLKKGYIDPIDPHFWCDVFFFAKGKKVDQCIYPFLFFI